ncbi:lipase family protein [Nocardia harenae]|uniref:lipase family protein n=1 Tax=Nocardia harenae TaxID=358707 RepID=UPI000AF3B249|nr:lipase family protein [Nocardia harenae]
MKASLSVVVTVLVGCALMGAPASAEPPYPVEPSIPAAPPAPLQEWIDNTLPAPAVAADEETLWRAVLPSPTGDPIFDTWPDNLPALAPGAIIETRDVTATTALRSTVPIARATLLKFRSTSATGAPSFGTATLIEPTAPWSGPGTRPVEVNALPINSLGTHCAPSYQMSHGLLEKPNGSLPVFLPAVWTALGKGHAVLLPDHEGPFMAYAEPNVAAHVVLDSIRAARGFLPVELGDSRYVAVGYSGGAIAAYAAAMKQDEYAPELAGVLVGAAPGGVVTDYVNVAHQFNGKISSGILLTVTLAIAREHPEILRHTNSLAQWVATSPLRDICGETSGPLGIVGIPVDVGADTPAPLDSEFARALFAQFDLTDRTSTVPLYIYHGLHDPWIPLDDAERVFRQQCARGVPSVFRVVAGEHLIGYVTGASELEGWIDGRLRGVAAPSEC